MNLIDKYLYDKDSICREERQYAVFLYNYLNSMKGKVWSDSKEQSLKCKLFGKDDITITHVFYEATFMRDFFYWDRKKCNESENSKNENLTKKRFNEYLLDYVCEIANIDKEILENVFGFEFKRWDCISERDILNKKIKRIKEYHLKMLNGTEDKSENMVDYYEYHLGMAIGKEVGKGKKHKIDFCENINILLKSLMNSKPDIAVVFMKNGISKLAFFECKFESPEGSSGKKESKISQTEAQNVIAYFLTKYFVRKADEEKCNVNEESSSYENLYQIAEDWEKTKIVNFYRDEAKSREDEVDICITELIDRYKNTIKVDLKSKYCKKKTKVENGGKNNDK